MITVEDSIKAYATQLYALKLEAADLFKQYFATGTDVLVGALATGTTPATVASALSKDEIIDGITMAESLGKFFDNVAPVMGDYVSVAQNLIHGSSVAGAELSKDVEDIGARLKAMGATIIQLQKDGALIFKSYWASELGLVVGAISADTVVPGATVTKVKMVEGITLVEQFLAQVSNQAVTQADYFATVAKWL